MPSNEENQILEFWNQAHALSVAPLRFGPPEAIAAYKSAMGKKLDIADDPTEGLPKDADLLDVVAALGRTLKPLANMYVDANRVHQDLRDHVLMRIANGVVWAVGYATPRRHTDAPVRIPPDVWSGKVDWDKGEVSGNGLHFVAVRVALPPKTPIDLISLPSESPKLGRPSLKNEILEAYLALEKGGIVDYSKPMVRLYQPIRDWLCVKYPNRAGTFGDLSDEAVRRIISSRFKSLRETKKQ